MRRIALSLDAPTSEVHGDNVPRVVGTDARDPVQRQTVGPSAQIDTTITTLNVDLLPRMVTFVKDVGAVQWSVSFLVSMGGGQELNMISPEWHERVFESLYHLALAGDFDINATAAPTSRRVAIQHGDGRAVGGAGFAFHDGLDRPVQSVNDGRGFLFVSPPWARSPHPVSCL